MSASGEPGSGGSKVADSGSGGAAAEGWVAGSGVAKRIAVASDHAGFPLKAPIIEYLRSMGFEAVDFGTDSTAPVDYPDVIAPAARAVASGACSLGVVLGGSGTGEQIVANKVRGIRCVEATDPVTARLAREHNDANVLAMGARIVGIQLALGCVAAFMEGRFQGGRHAPRLEKIRLLEDDFLASSEQPSGTTAR